MTHVFSDYLSKDVETQRRHAVARQTWAAQGWNEHPIADRSVQCHHGFPVVRELIDLACRELPLHEIWVFTNSDICIASDGRKRIEEKLKSQACTYAFRRDFSRLHGPIPDHMIGTGYDYCGTDLFAGTVGWWKTHGQQMPDMVIGNEAWDAVFRVLMESTKHGSESMAIPNLIYHERHASAWENAQNRYRLPSQLHNLQAAWKWLIRRKINPTQFGIRMV
jgi:hypothetical protein